MYENDNRYGPEREGPTFDEHYEYDDLDLSYLDSYSGDDDWSRRFEATGSIDYDPDWM